MQLRSSSHQLNCETGRYASAKELEKRGIATLWMKRCEFCTDDEAASLLHLPFGDTILENEAHVLITCPRYHMIRTSLINDTKSHLLRNEEHWKLFQGSHLKPFAIYIKKIWKTRFPKDKSKAHKKIHHST